MDPQTGGVCVETLKRDWQSKLTLRDVLITISCLLIQPNPDSALNAEAGVLIQEDYALFERRAVLMTSIHATIPDAMLAAAKEAQTRGQEEVEEPSEEHILPGVQQRPARRRRTIAQVRAQQKKSHEAADPNRRKRRHQQEPSSIVAQQPFVCRVDGDDQSLTKK